MASNYYYYRASKAYPLVGPMSLVDAEDIARWLSLQEDGIGMAEVCTYVGNRPNDPVLRPPKLFVVSMFIRGKLTLKGGTANYNSRHGLPPLGPWRYGY